MAIGKECDLTFLSGGVLVLEVVKVVSAVLKCVLGAVANVVLLRETES